MSPALHLSRQLIVRRICAYLFDGVVIGVLWASLAYLELDVVSSVLRQLGRLVQPSFVAFNFLIGPPFVLAAFGVSLLYGIIMEETPWRATFGKRVFALKITVSSAPVSSFVRILLRNLLKIVVGSTIFVLAIASYIQGTIYLGLRAGPVGRSMATALVSMHWIVFAIMFALGVLYLLLRFGPASQVLHDRLAGTQLGAANANVAN